MLVAFVPALLYLIATDGSPLILQATAVALGLSVFASVAQAVHRRRIHASSAGLPPADLAALQKAVETMQIGVTITELDGTIVYSNPADARLHGYDPEELVGQDVGLFSPGKVRRRVSAADLQQFSSWEREAINVRKDGTTFTALLLSDVVRDARGDPVAIVTTCEDITDRKRNEERLYHDAFHDGLTALPNRAMFTQLLERAIARMRRRGGPQYAVLFLDLDRFKVVNDSLGHALGDLLLIETAARLAKCVRPGDAVARLGGDEFTLLLDAVDSPSDATRVAHRVLQALETRFELDGHELFMSGSIGIAIGTTEYHTPEEVLRDADIAMYRAKSRGVGRYELFDKTMHQRAVELLELETGLRRALDRDELRLHYQPILGPAEQIHGFEALMRWEHPTRGLLEPAAFVQVAEETGLIIRIGWWTIEEACRQLKTWQVAFPQDPPLTVSVNLSPLQFQQADLVPRVIATTEYHEIAPGSLRLEITESALMRSADANIAVLEDLATAGVRVMIDDFGTGYSSLAYLQRFRVSTLKIDKSFVHSLTERRQNAEIVRTIVSLARALGLSVVAEGVETREAQAALALLGCDEMQGFLFWGALDPLEIEPLLRAPALR
ncbi:MAG: EAL domain-containing protein [Gemmatimonadales bacterium]